MASGEIICGNGTFEAFLVVTEVCKDTEINEEKKEITKTETGSDKSLVRRTPSSVINRSLFMPANNTE